MLQSALISYDLGSPHRHFSATMNHVLAPPFRRRDQLGVALFNFSSLSDNAISQVPHICLAVSKPEFILLVCIFSPASTIHSSLMVSP